MQVGFRYVMFFMGAVALIYGLISLISGSSLFIPGSAGGVLDSVDQGTNYTWSSESIRLVELGGHRQVQQAARGTTVNLATNKFQAVVAGVLPERTTYTSDGQFTKSLTESDQLGEDGSWQVVTNYCGGAPTVPANTLQMPTPDELKAADPKIQTTEGTDPFGHQAWILSIKATPIIVKRLMWLPFFNQALKADPASMPWVISTSERKKINAGDFKTLNGQVWINRDGTRKIEQIDLKIAIDGGSEYRFLAQIVPVSSPDQNLNTLSYSPPSCN